MLSVVVGCVLEHFGVVLGYQIGVYVEVVGGVEPLAVVPAKLDVKALIVL